MRIGVFGGTFDPPHLGHLILACEAYDQLRLDKLLWVLTPDPPHKQGKLISPDEIRLEMVLAAIQDEPVFELSRVEIDRPGPQYAVDTIRLLHEQFPGAALVYLIGGDSLQNLPTWFRSQDLVDETDEFGVMHRPDELVDLTHLETALPGISAKVRFVNAPLLEISSSEIRERANQGRPFRYYVSPAVYRIIQKRRLYRSE